MPFVDIKDLPVGERLPGWRDRTFHSGNVTIAHYTFDQDASIHEHWHPNEEVWNVIEGGLEVTISTAVKVAGPGFAAVVPPNTPHSVLALSNGRAMVVDYPIRRFDTNRQRAGLAIDFSNPVALPDAKNGDFVAIRFELRSWAQMPALVKDFRMETGVSPSLRRRSRRKFRTAICRLRGRFSPAGHGTFARSIAD
jgi:quercetin dioxygenase-like cupin family protein